MKRREQVNIGGVERPNVNCQRGFHKYCPKTEEVGVGAHVSKSLSPLWEGEGFCLFNSGCSNHGF